MQAKELLEKFSSVISLSGYEYMAEKELRKIIADDFGGVFDEVYFDKFGGCHMIKKADASVDSPKKLLLDAHLDQIGLVVTDILDGGFLHVKSLGGFDMNVLIASEFYVYTYNSENPFIFSSDNKIRAIAVSVPPHLKKSGDNLPRMEELLLDTGYSKEELQKIVKVGSPVSFKPEFTVLENELVASTAFDDRICGEIFMLAVKSLEKAPDVEVHIVMSVGEETSGLGAKTAAFSANPDFAVVFDVGFSRDPGVDAAGSGEIGKGAEITYATFTNIPLTKKVVKLAKENDPPIPVQITANPGSTGTNANVIQVTGEGIPCVLLSLPLKNMHGPNEICSLKDIEYSADLIKKIIESANDLV